jgi:hypothetical protein
LFVVDAATEPAELACAHLPDRSTLTSVAVEEHVTQRTQEVEKAAREVASGGREVEVAGGGREAEVVDGDELVG